MQRGHFAVSKELIYFSSLPPQQCLLGSISPSSHPGRCRRVVEDLHHTCPLSSPNLHITMCSWSAWRGGPFGKGCEKPCEMAIAAAELQEPGSGEQKIPPCPGAAFLGLPIPQLLPFHHLCPLGAANNPNSQCHQQNALQGPLSAQLHSCRALGHAASSSLCIGWAVHCFPLPHPRRWHCCTLGFLFPSSPAPLPLDFALSITPGEGPAAARACWLLCSPGVAAGMCPPCPQSPALLLPVLAATELLGTAFSDFMLSTRV